MMLQRDPAPSSARLWPFTARFIAAEERLGRRFAEKGKLAAGLYEFMRFGVKQGWACLFGGFIVALLIGTRLWYPTAVPLTRYDFLFVSEVPL